MFQQLETVLFMVIITERIVELLYIRFLKRVFESYHIDKTWLMVIAWLIGSALAAATEINLFAEFIPNPWIGWGLTAIVAGGGSNLLHDLFSALKPSPQATSGTMPVRIIEELVKRDEVVHRGE